MTLLTLILCITAFALFGLSTHAHHRRWFGGTITSAGKGVLRGPAWLALALGFVCAVVASGWVFGPILWMGMVMLGAGCVFLFLNLAPARFERSK
jgi:hypothetical protein